MQLSYRVDKNLLVVGVLLDREIPEKEPLLKALRKAPGVREVQLDASRTVMSLHMDYTPDLYAPPQLLADIIRSYARENDYQFPDQAVVHSSAPDAPYGLQLSANYDADGHLAL